MTATESHSATAVETFPSTLSTDQQQKFPWRSVGMMLFIGTWLLPPLLILGFMWRFAVDEPFMDDFAFGDTFHTMHIQGFTWARLTAQHNEFRPLFPRLILQGLDRISRWDVRYQMGTSYLFVLLTSLLMIRLCRKTIRHPAIALAAAALIDFILFCPVQWQGFLWGILMVTFIPTFSLVIILLCVGSRLPIWMSTILAGVAAVFATYSNTSAILIWVLVIPAFLIHPSKYRLPALTGWLILAAVSIGYYFHNYHKPEGHPSMMTAVHNPVDAGKFMLAFLGNGVRQTTDFDKDVSLGLLAVIVWSLGVFYLLIAGRNLAVWRRALPWIVIGGFSIGCAATTTLGRFGLGPPAAIEVRYPTYAIALWLSLVPLWIVIFEYSVRPNSWQEKLTWALSTVGGVAVAGLMIKGTLFIRSEVLDFNAEQLAGRSAGQFALVAPDDNAIIETTYPEAGTPRAIIAEMDGDDLYHPECFRSSDISTIAANNPSVTIGSFDVLTPTGDQLMAAGWAYIPTRMTPADAVLLTTPDAAGVERIFAICTQSRFVRQDVADAMHCRQLDRSGWTKYIAKNRLPHGAVVSAWAFDTYGRRAYRLNATHQVP